MPSAGDIELLKNIGAGRPASLEVARLYDLAFRDFGAACLWNRNRSDKPTFSQALTIADSLRHEGNNKARALAVQIEDACRVAL